MNRDQAHRDGLQQGRKIRRNYGRRVACWICDAIYMAAILGAVALFILMLGGCAEVPRVYVENGVVMHENDLTPCERGAAGCYVNGEIYYTTFDLQAKDHEILHSKGMQHAAWKMEGQYVCAIVTAQGSTKWTVGTKMCRNSRGEFLKV